MLRKPATYAEHSTGVDVVETHISIVFLTAHHAYKLKKPVRYEFVDFSTVEARHQACEEEVRLNRRLAPDVYLGVVPITETSDGQLELGGTGSPVEWVVQMRRLPADRFLDQMIRTHRIHEDDVARLAVTLSDFYRQLPPIEVRPDDYRCRIEEHVRANFAELLLPEYGLPTEIVKRVHSAQMQFLKLSARTLDERVIGGHIVEGHGDLRPEHICLESRPVIFDCIEFNRQFREIDVVDELSFLAMECDALEAESIGTRILDAYFQASVDRPSSQLVNFYRTYRACVRAKVAVLRARQLAADRRPEPLVQAMSLLMLADRYQKSFATPRMLVVRGLSGTGKSTLAQALAESLGLEWLSTDQVRREMFGSSSQSLEYGQQRYQADARARVYAELFRRADEMLRVGLSIVLDGTFLRLAWQAEATSLGARHGTTPLFINCHCPAAVAKQRIEKRLSQPGTLSEVQPLMHDLQHQEEEQSPAGTLPIHVDTTESIAAQIATVVNRLASQAVPLTNNVSAFV